MKVKRLKADYEIDQPIGQILGVVLDTGTRTNSGHAFQLYEISPAEMDQMRKGDRDKDSAIGRPIYYARTRPQQILLAPTPDEDAELIITFYPPQVTI